MRFIDRAKAYVRAGNGGNGCVSLRRKRFQPKGGPDGGDGGKGGDVIFVGDAQMAGLHDLSSRPRLIAQDGQQGKGNNQSGRDGHDLVVRLPIGTLVIDARTNDVLEDLNEDQKRFLAARGGRGGRGNARFVTPSNQAPRRAQKGEKGEARWLRFELKLAADVALIGRPNAGKSTLISKISSARPRIADYPFTTKSPHLGVVRYGDFKSFVVADTPGLIENAHRGCGLGIDFLKHVERTALLVHVLDITRLPDQSPLEDYEILIRELGAFSPALREKPHLVAINKVDLLDSSQPLEETERIFAELGISPLPISALTEKGLGVLVEEIAQRLEELKPIVSERGSIGTQEPSTRHL